MKLKRLLSGVTAAIMALSAVAVASFTSVSAEGEYVKIFHGEAGAKIFAQGVVDAELAGATKVVISANAGATPQGFNEMCTLQITSSIGGKSGFIELKPANPAWPGPKSTTYTWDLTDALVENDSYVFTGGTFSWEDCTTEDNWIIGITKVEFYKGAELLKTQTEVGEAPPVQTPPSQDSSDQGSTGGSLTANLYFASKDFEVQPNGTDENGGTVGVPLTIDEDGEYTFNVTSLETDKWRGNVSDVDVFVIDFLDARKTHPGMKAELLSITVPDYNNNKEPKEVTFDKSKTIFGDIEYPKNENLRLEIYNTFGETKENPPIDPLDIYFEYGDTMTVKIKVTDFAKKVDSNIGDNSNNNNKTTAKTTPSKVVPAKKTTRSAAVVKKDKSAAQKAMKQAKITKLTAKSKAKKKITVSWKKVKKAKGYQVQVAAKKNFKKSIIKKFTKKTKLTVKSSKIKSKKTYYVRARAYATYKDKNGKAQKVYSKWSKKIRKVKAK